MFFNTLERKLNKLYGTLNPKFKNQVFPNGEQEFVYVGKFLNLLFNNRDVFNLIQIYASVYTYYSIETANAAKTYFYAREKTRGILSDDETVTLLALVSLNMVATKMHIPDPMVTLEEYKSFINSYIDTVIGISKNLKIFATKDSDVGTTENPILVDGVKGIRTYLESIDFNVESIKYDKSQTLYLTDNETQISYAIDEYTVTDTTTGVELVKLWFNIYGTENCQFAPDGLKFK